MATPVVLSKAAVLARLRAELSEDVLSSAPLRWRLPYVNHVATRIGERRQINKASELWTIETSLDIVSDPHEEGIKTADDLSLEVDEALETAITIAGYEVSTQRISQSESLRELDSEGAELEIVRLTFQMEIL